MSQQGCYEIRLKVAYRLAASLASLTGLATLIGLGKLNNPGPGSSDPPHLLTEDENDKDVYDDETLPLLLEERVSDVVIGIGSACAAARERERSESRGQWVGWMSTAKNTISYYHQ